MLDRLNGDSTVEVSLTATGRAQAVELGRKAGAVDLVAHTEFRRTTQTAELAWPDAPLLVVPELNEIAFGRFEGTHWSEGYHEWVLASDPDEVCPGGGESRLGAIRRYLTGFHLVLQRTEDRVALVAHGAPVRYLLLALESVGPTRVLETVPPATPFVIEASRCARALALIEDWAVAPSFSSHYGL